MTPTRVRVLAIYIGAIARDGRDAGHHAGQGSFWPSAWSLALITGWSRSCDSGMEMLLKTSSDCPSWCSILFCPSWVQKSLGRIPPTARRSPLRSAWQSVWGKLIDRTIIIITIILLACFMFEILYIILLKRYRLHTHTNIVMPSDVDISIWWYIQKTAQLTAW